jgi:hypothetical protein
MLRVFDGAIYCLAREGRERRASLLPPQTQQRPFQSIDRVLSRKPNVVDFLSDGSVDHFFTQFVAPLGTTLHAALGQPPAHLLGRATRSFTSG